MSPIPMPSRRQGVRVFDSRSSMSGGLEADSIAGEFASRTTKAFFAM
jgi:hypothetical protein